jgi:hypothetical protein
VENKPVITYSEAAARLGTDYRTVSGVVRVKRIRPKPTGLSGRAARTGLDEDDFKILKRSLAPV